MVLVVVGVYYLGAMLAMLFASTWQVIHTTRIIKETD